MEHIQNRIINSQQITTPSNDPNNFEAPTPNHLLLPKPRPSLPPGIFQKEDLYDRSRWIHVQYTSSGNAGLRNICLNSKNSRNGDMQPESFLPGGIVLIFDEAAPWKSWVIGRIIHSDHPVKDEHGLVCQVCTKTKTNELDRPITKVCIYETVVKTVLLQCVKCC